MLLIKILTSVALSSDGKYLASGYRDNTIKIWEFATGKEIHTLTSHTEEVTSVALSSNGKYVVSASDDNTIKVWNLIKRKREIHTITGHSSSVNAVAISSDDKYIVSASGDKTIKIWELATAKEIATFTGEGSIYCCAITKNNTTIIAGDESGKVHFLRLEGIEV